jgi:D-arabinose 1-dehydrogenase-like Zn-dependent alcohol dehydrogenase
MVLVNEKFLIKIDLPIDDERLPRLCPIMCAGVTVWSALRRVTVNDKRIIIKGFGGVGEMAARICKSFGAHVTVVTSRPRSSCAHVDAFIGEITNDMIRTFDVLILTTSKREDLSYLLTLLRPLGTAIVLGLPHHKFQLSAFDLVDTGLTIMGSSVGSLDDTKEIIDYTTVKFEKDAVQDVFNMLRDGTGNGRYVVAMT